MPLNGIGLGVLIMLYGGLLFGGLLLMSALFWLLERNEFQIIRMLTDKRPQLVFGPLGIDIIQKRKAIFIKWENVIDLYLGIREMDGDDRNNELYIYTQGQGDMCLPIDQLAIESVPSFRKKTNAWWNWVKAERLRE